MNIVRWSASSCRLPSTVLPEDLPDFELNLVRRVTQAPRSPTQAPGRPPITPDQGEKRKNRGSPLSLSPASSTAKQQRTISSNIHPAGSKTPKPPDLSLSNRFQ